MKLNLRLFPMLAALLAGHETLLTAQTFDLGSDGSYGAINVANSQNVTLPMPADGVFHCTTITLGSGASITFTKNSANTPVYLLATGDIILANGANIRVSGADANGAIGGRGGPGGFDGGHGGTQPGDGQGPGGGKAGWNNTGSSGKPAEVKLRGSGAFATRSTDANQADTAGSVYGNALLLPIIGGSGGGGGMASSPLYALGGGGGGGAIVIASNTKISFGTSGNHLESRGGSGSFSGFQTGNGSGGAIRLVAPVIEGTVDLRLRPGISDGPTYGGYGRGRIDRLNTSGLTITSEGGYVTYGSNMTVFPPNFPGLRITQVGNHVIPAEQTAPVFVLFPTGSSATQTVTVSVTNFLSNVPLRAVVTPASGSTATFDFSVDNTAGGTSTGSVDVQIPAGVSSRVDVWTR